MSDAPANIAAEPPAASAATPTVLIVEPSAHLADLYADVLRTHGACARCVRTDTTEGATDPEAMECGVVLCSAGRTVRTRLDPLHALLGTRADAHTIFMAPPDDPYSALSALRIGAADALVRAPGYLEQLPLTVRKAGFIRARQADLAARVRDLTRIVDEIQSDNTHLRTLAARLHELAATDSLTELPNRRALEQSLERMHSAASRYATDLSILVIDIDGLKQINDVLGHAAGDEALRTAADLIRTHFRRSDAPARIGGDEFVVLLPNTGAEHAAKVARRLQLDFTDRVRALQARLDQALGQVGVVTLVRSRGSRSTTDQPARLGMTIGIASRNIFPDASPTKLLQLADQAMCVGKAAGRNRVQIQARAPRVIAPAA